LGSASSGDLDLAAHLRPGDTVIVGQATAEPPALVEELIEAAHAIKGITAFCGYALTPAWARTSAARPSITSYAGHGALRMLAERGLVNVIPCHYSRIEELITTGRISADVVLLQVAAADADGHYDLGPTVDYVAVAAHHARAVLVEVNAQLPRTRSSRRLQRSLVTASRPSSRPVVGSPARAATELERRVAKNVATLIPSGATLQLGVGALAEAIATELRPRRGLRIRTGLVGDWVLGLYRAGALDKSPGSCVTGMALGTSELYRFIEKSSVLNFAPVAEQLAPGAIAACNAYVAVNSAMEVDLEGQVNSEVVGGRYVGAVGGQVDYFRAARGCETGMAIVAITSVSESGASRVVERLSGPVTSLKSDVDFVVTEWGVADLRGAPFTVRAEALAAVAHPRYRDQLRRHRQRWS
jgi:acyl-CoA hydrolase